MSQPFPHEDSLKDNEDRIRTHNDPGSPWYDGPDADEEAEEEE